MISNCEITSRKTDKTHNDDDIYFFRSRLTDTALKERRAHRQRRTERNAGGFIIQIAALWQNITSGKH